MNACSGLVGGFSGQAGSMMSEVAQFANKFEANFGRGSHSVGG
jgi:hypothetical protein